ncbi:MAG: hypothetical protein WC100_02310 [Sterolibacterium sp.]
METYPTLTKGVVSSSSTEKTLDDLQVDRATNGAPRIRALYTAAKKQFTVIHEGAVTADKSTMQTFYGTNRLLSITFVWPADSASYTCYFAAPPQYKPVDGGYWTITNELTEA